MRMRILGLVGLSGLLVATAACGDEGGDPETFCAESGPALALLDDWVAGGDPTGPGLGEAVEALQDPEPPSEIADEWNSVVDGVTALEEVDRGDPEAVAAAVTGVEDAASDLQEVEDYLGRSC